MVRAIGVLAAGPASFERSDVGSIGARARRALARSLSFDGTRTVFAATLLTMAGAAAGIVVARQVRFQIRGDHAYYDAFSRLVSEIPEPRAIVFVRYGANHNDGLSLVRNPADAKDAKVWTVYDRGAENARLLSAAPDRAAYLFDESSWTLRPIPRAVPNGSDVASVMADSLRERRGVRRRR